MRIFLYILSSFLISTAFFSCKKKNKFLSDQNTAVVVGVLDASETTHFIKITRAFIGDGVTNSNDIAKIPDSLYFGKVYVSVDEINSNGTILRTFQLHDTLIKNKSTNGVFFAPEQKVYVFYTSPGQMLNTEHKYKMTAKLYKSASTADNTPDFIVEAETDLTKGMSYASNFAGPYNYLVFAGNPGEYKSQTIPVYTVGTAKRLVGNLQYQYYDYTNGGTDSTYHAIDIPLGEFDINEGTKSYNFFLSGQQFYENLKQKIAASNGIDYRRCSNIRISVTGANQILSNYIAVNKPSTSIAQNKPDFTNLKIIKGEKLKTIGVFASRTTIILDKPFARAGFAQIQGMDRNSRRELCIGTLTGHLRFCSWHQSDINANFSWACN